jgi:hypothetical protein
MVDSMPTSVQLLEANYCFVESVLFIFPQKNTGE